MFLSCNREDQAAAPRLAEAFESVAAAKLATWVDCPIADVRDGGIGSTSI
jgi:hypothetical protein